MSSKRPTTTNKCTSAAGHFDGHADVWVQCCLYHPMQHVQGYTRTLWTPPLGDYSLCVTPSTARATGNTKNAPTLLAILLAMTMHRYVTVCITWWRRSMGSLEATGCRHWVSIHSNRSNQSWQHRLFLSFFIINFNIFLCTGCLFCNSYVCDELFY